MRSVLCVAMASVWISAALLYAIAHETRQAELRLESLERTVEKARRDVSVMKAEWAHLSRPERIEALARKQGLQPPSPDQFQRSAKQGLPKEAVSDLALPGPQP